MSSINLRQRLNSTAAVIASVRQTFTEYLGEGLKYGGLTGICASFGACAVALTAHALGYNIPVLSIGEQFVAYDIVAIGGCTVSGAAFAGVGASVASIYRLAKNGPGRREKVGPHYYTPSLAADRFQKLLTEQSHASFGFDDKRHYSAPAEFIVEIQKLPKESAQKLMSSFPAIVARAIAKDLLKHENKRNPAIFARALVAVSELPEILDHVTSTLFATWLKREARDPDSPIFRPTLQSAFTKDHCQRQTNFAIEAINFAMPAGNRSNLYPLIEGLDAETLHAVFKATLDGCKGFGEHTIAKTQFEVLTEFGWVLTEGEKWARPNAAKAQKWQALKDAVSLRCAQIEHMINAALTAEFREAVITNPELQGCGIGNLSPDAINTLRDIALSQYKL